MSQSLYYVVYVTCISFNPYNNAMKYVLYSLVNGELRSETRVHLCNQNSSPWALESDRPTYKSTCVLNHFLISLHHYFLKIGIILVSLS